LKETGVLENGERLERDDGTLTSTDGRRGAVVGAPPPGIFGYGCRGHRPAHRTLHLSDDLPALLQEGFAHNHAEPRRSVAQPTQGPPRDRRRAAVS
jgi:hypothetical protein